MNLTQEIIDYSLYIKRLDKRIYIYGCGDNGACLYRYLCDKEVSISGFLDTYVKGCFEGMPVKTLSQVDWSTDYVLIASTSWEEISEQIRKAGGKLYENYIYVNERVTVLKAKNYRDCYLNQLIGAVDGTICSMRMGGIISVGNNVVLEEGVRLTCEGFSKIYIGDNSVIRSGTSIICANNSEVHLNNRVDIGINGNITVGGQSRLVVGEKTDFDQNIEMRVLNNSEVIIGEDCMFSYDIKLRGDNGHLLYDINTKKDISTRKNVTIANHCWIGMGAFVMAGTNLGESCVVGAGSLINNQFEPHSLIAGTPGKVIRGEVGWER